MPLDPQCREILDLLESLGLPQLSELPLDQLRAVTLEMAKQRPVEDVASAVDITLPGPAGEVPARVYRPLGSSPDEVLPVLVYVHGGGWTIGSVESYDGTARSLANRSGAAVCSVEYRLGPEHPFPAAVEDSWAALQWVAGGNVAGVDPSRIAVGGDSAGGNLAAVLALLARDAGLPLRLQVLVYPAVDARCGHASIDENAEGYLLTKADMLWFYECYGVGTTVPDDDWQLSPLMAPDHIGVAPAVVITAEFDPLRDEGEAYVETLRLAGVPVAHTRYDGMIHGFFGMLGQIDMAAGAHAEVGTALRHTLA